MQQRAAACQGGPGGFRNIAHSSKTGSLQLGQGVPEAVLAPIHPGDAREGDFGSYELEYLVFLKPVALKPMK